MKKSFSFLVLFVLLTGSLLLANCSKEPGPQGQAGTQGAKGEKGDPAPANVIYSPWIAATFTGSATGYLATIPAPMLTQPVLDQADIRLYWQEGGRVLSLPYAQVIGNTTYSVHQRLYVGRIELLASYALGPQSFRYVIIVGTTPTGRLGSLDYSNYQQVKQVFHLPD